MGQQRLNANATSFTSWFSHDSAQCTSEHFNPKEAQLLASARCNNKRHQALQVSEKLIGLDASRSIKVVEILSGGVAQDWKILIVGCKDSEVARSAG